MNSLTASLSLALLLLATPQAQSSSCKSFFGLFGALQSRTVPVQPPITAYHPTAADFVVVAKPSASPQIEMVERIVRGLNQVGAESRMIPSGPQGIWVRDWFPLVVRSGNQMEFVAFKYHYRDGVAMQEHMIGALERAGYFVRRSDLRMEFGNIIVTDLGHVIYTDSPILRRENKGYSADQIRTEIENVTGSTTIALPYVRLEDTGHADVFSTYLGENRFVVARSRDASVNADLDAVAAALTANGYRVERLQMAGDGVVPRSKKGRTWSDFFPYTNNLVVGDSVILPTYYQYAASQARLGSFPLGRDIETVRQDDRSAVRFFQNLGYRVEEVPMNEVVELGGMVHCLTACLPRQVAQDIRSTW